MTDGLEFLLADTIRLVVWEENCEFLCKGRCVSASDGRSAPRADLGVSQRQDPCNTEADGLPSASELGQSSDH